MAEPPSKSPERKLSLGALIALVVGSMVGSGIFALPSAFGRATGVLGGLICVEHRGRRNAVRGLRLSEAVAAQTRIGFRHLLAWALLQKCDNELICRCD
jgi:hypothetical protein